MKLYAMPRWQDRAACREADMDLFFPSRGVSTAYSKALAYCAMCPVTGRCRKECDEVEALYGGTHGVWGNETPEMRKARRIIAKRRASQPLLTR